MEWFKHARKAALVAGLTALVVLVCWTTFEVRQTDQRLAQVQQQQDVLSQAAAEVRERIVELPNDGQTYYISLLLHADWRQRPRERAIVSWWATEPRLLSVRAQCHYFEMIEGDPRYVKTFSHVTPILPSVYIQDATGKVHFKVSDQNLPANADEMGGLIVELFRNRPWLRPLPWNRPRPCPSPGPCPLPTPVPGPNPIIPIVPPIPDTVRPDGSQPGGSFPWALLIVAVAGAGLGSLAWNIHRAVNKTA